MGGDLGSLICVHFIKVMGLNRAALENLRIDHIAFPDIGNQRAKGGEILTVAQQILLGKADKPFRSLGSAKRWHCGHWLAAQVSGQQIKWSTLPNTPDRTPQDD